MKGRARMDSLEKDIILFRLNSIAYSIDVVSRNLRSKIPELKNDAERIRDSLKESIPRFQKNRGVKNFFNEYVGGVYPPVDFLFYLTSVEDAYEQGGNPYSIIEEMNKSISSVQRKLHE